MKKLRLLMLMILLLLPPSIHSVTQEDTGDSRAPTLEITGVNPTDLPTILITANIFDPLLQPTRGLSAENFTLSGDLEGVAEIVNVENVTDDNLPIAAVLMIDTSSSMAGRPLDEAKQAARDFVNALGPDDQVAVLTFNSTVRLVQDYTSDKEELMAAIDALGFGGRTALYEAAVRAIDKAVDAPNPRRAAILLSDGAEFGGVSRALRGAALEEAMVRGVAVYTIGLGYGIDRSYLIELSSGTNARNYESPTPDELPEIYAELAGLLRSQYVITINADIPGDGTEYTITLQAETPAGMTNEATTTFRAPIPIPLLTAPDLGDEPITEETEITVDVRADDDLVHSETTFTAPSGETVEEIVTEDTAQNTFTVGPANFAPGTYSVTHMVRDEDGDEGSVTFDIEIGALPSVITLEPDLTGLTLDTPVTITVDASGQTDVVEAAVTIAGQTTTFDGTPFTFDLDPFALPPGDQILTVEVTNEGGVTSTNNVAFIVETFAPVISIEGLDADTVFSGSFLPGDSTSATVSVLESQTPVTEVGALVDGVSIGEPLAEPPYEITLPDFLDLGSGNHTLTVIVTNEGGGSTEATLNFSVEVIATPTPTATASPSPTPTVDVQGTTDANATVTATVLAGQAIVASRTANAQATLDIESTAAAEDEATASLEAQATFDQEATIDAETMGTVTAESEETATDVAEQDMTATAESESNATLTEAAATEAEATREQQASIAQATTDSQSTATAAAQEEATITSEAEATQTADAEQEATDAADEAATQTADAELEATIDAEASETADAEQEATATANAEVTQTADAEVELANVQATETAEQDVTATANAETTLVAQVSTEVTEEATLTEEQPTATLTATQEATQELTATLDIEVSNPTPVGELTEVEQSGAETDQTPWLPIIGVGVLILLVLVFLLSRRGRAT